MRRRTEAERVVDIDDTVILDAALPKRLWDQIEKLRVELGDDRTLEQLAADLIAAGLSLTHGAG